MTNEEKQKRLRLLELEEEEFQYQQSLKSKSAEIPQGINLPGVSPEIGKWLSGGLEGAQEATPAVLAGAAQGATLGFSDELGATGDTALELGKQAISGQVPDMLSTPQKWREFQKQREAANKALKEESPMAYLGGEVLGGAATIPLMPSLGGAKLVGAAGKLSPTAAKFLAGQTGGTVGKIAGKGLESAIESAPAGALYGFGSSEANIDRPAELAMDTVSGAGIGSLAGLAVGGTIAGTKAAAEAVPELAKKFDFTRKLGEAYEMGTEGAHFDTTSGKKTVGQQYQSMAQDVTDQILSIDKKLGEAVGNSLENSTKLINISPELKAASDDLFQIFANNPVLLHTVDPKSKALLAKISQSPGADLTPIEARALKDTFFNLSEKLSGMTSDVSYIARQKGIQLGKAINTELKKQIPEYAQAAQEFSQFRSEIPEVALQYKIPAEYRTKTMGKLKEPELKLFEGIKTVLGGARLPGAPVVEGERAAFEEMLSNLTKLKQAKPEVMSKLDPEQWSKMADRMAVLRQAQGVEPHESLTRTLWGQIVGSGEGTGYNIAQKAGQIVSSKPGQFTKKIFSYPMDKLGGIAQKLKASNIKGASIYGEKLEKALANKSESGKNAVLFALLQDPDYREFLKSEGLDE